MKLAALAHDVLHRAMAALCDSVGHCDGSPQNLAAAHRLRLDAEERAQKAERERDEWRAKCESIRAPALLVEIDTLDGLNAEPTARRDKRLDLDEPGEGT